MTELQQTIIGPDGKPGPDWKTDPAKYVSESTLTETLDTDVDAILADYLPQNQTHLGHEDIAKLLQSVAKSIGTYPLGRSNKWLAYGPIVIPATQNGVAILRQLRDYAKSTIDGNANIAELVDDGSKIGKLLQALSKVEGSAILAGYRNATLATRDADCQGIRLKLDLELHNLPKGETLPKQLLVPALLGQEIRDGGQAEAIRNSMGACVGGFSEFLNDHGINHETDAIGECGSCGQTNDDDEPSEISWCEKFKLTKEILDDLDESQQDDLREALGDDDDSSDSWAELLNLKADHEIRKLLLPEEKSKDNGIKYDTTVYTFVPDFQQIDGLEELPFAELARILPILQSVDDAYRAQGILPPIPGTLRKASRTYHDRKGSSVWAWEPDCARLSHQGTTAGLTVAVNVLHGQITLSYDGEVSTVTMTQNPATKYLVTENQAYSGDRAELWVGIAQGELRI